LKYCVLILHLSFQEGGGGGASDCYSKFLKTDFKNINKQKIWHQDFYLRVKLYISIHFFFDWKSSVLSNSYPENRAKGYKKKYNSSTIKSCQGFNSPVYIDEVLFLRWRRLKIPTLWMWERIDNPKKQDFFCLSLILNLITEHSLQERIFRPIRRKWKSQWHCFYQIRPHLDSLPYCKLTEHQKLVDTTPSHTKHIWQTHTL